MLRKDPKASIATLEVTRKSYEQQIRAAKNLVEKSELDMRTLPVRSAIESERLRWPECKEELSNEKATEVIIQYYNYHHQYQH